MEETRAVVRNFVAHGRQGDQQNRLLGSVNFWARVRQEDEQMPPGQIAFRPGRYEYRCPPERKEQAHQERALDCRQQAVDFLFGLNLGREFLG